MAVKVAINGFGRIGRLAFRQMFGAEGYDSTALRTKLRHTSMQAQRKLLSLLRQAMTFLLLYTALTKMY